MPAITYNSSYTPSSSSSSFRSSHLTGSVPSVPGSHKFSSSISSASSASIASTCSSSSAYSSSGSSTYGSYNSASRSYPRSNFRAFTTQSSVASTPRSSITSFNSLQNSPSASTATPSYLYSASPLAALNSPSNVTLTSYQRRSSFTNDLDTGKSYLTPLSSSSSASTLKTSSSYTQLIKSPKFWHKTYKVNNCDLLNLSQNTQQIPNYLAGLNNLGNTCYMNSVLQALYSTQLFKKFVTRNPKGSLLTALGKLYEDMSEPENNVAYPTSFRSQFIKFQPKFRGYDQQDAQEFLRYLINGIHEEVNQAKYSTRPKHFKSPRSSSEAWEQYKYIDDSPLIDLVAGQLASTIRCTICGHSSTCYDPFWDLSLPLPTNIRECDVLRCLDEFTALEHMDAGELVTCERCNRQRRCTKELSIVKMPTVLILHLKRFSNEGYKLSYPRITPNERLTIAGRQFQLYSMVCHHGNSSRSGHYTAYCIHNGKWYHFNDEKISEESSFKPSNCDDAYILFYIDKERDRASYSSRL